MGIGRQAKPVNKQQIEAVISYLSNTRNGVRDRLIFLLSAKAGLRAKEIAALRWPMVLNPDGEVGDSLALTNAASKGKSGRVIHLNKSLRVALVAYHAQERTRTPFDPANDFVIRTERSASTSAQAIVNMFWRWYRDLGLIGCSSHSGRRTFITNAAKKIPTVGGSLRDVQWLAGHASLQTTQRYIEGEEQARVRVVDLL
jgi:integrase